MDRIIRLLIPLLLLVLATGCSSKDSGEQMDYDAHKNMVMDILKSDDGKKALTENMKEDGMKETLIMDQPLVVETIEKSLTSEEGKAFWKEALKDPKFAHSLAESMKTENEQLLKDLMKDPEYRKAVIEIFKDPEVEKDLMEAMKSNEYREQMQTVIIETFESPLFKAQLEDLIIQASSEIHKNQENKKGK